MPSGFPPLPELVLATSNPGKLLEFRAILGDLSVAFRALEAFPEVQLPEEGDDYETNAVAKARAIAEGAGRPALADDSGIEVAALGGRPGPRSARFGGGDLDDAGRVERLLTEVTASGRVDRSARFVCVAALAFPGGEVITARGECPGRILDAPRGRSGFGYDPIFEVEGGGRSMAELPPSEKNRISHRARALLSLREVIQERIAST
jgi:XTP/dITP diphosphohydrolase